MINIQRRVSGVNTPVPFMRRIWFLFKEGGRFRERIKTEPFAKTRLQKKLVSFSSIGADSVSDWGMALLSPALGLRMPSGYCSLYQLSQIL